MRTVDEMYCLPKRSESYRNLQTAIDEAMTGLTYCAPTSGENQQTVQTADLTGNSVAEYLVFAKDETENTLRILIFSQEADRYSLMTQIECLGSGFEQVEYADIDADAGMELVVGCRVSDDVMGAVSVYSFSHGQAEQMVSSHYTKFIACDLDGDERGELLILRAGDDEADRSNAVLLDHRDGVLTRSREVALSERASCIKRIMPGCLHGGTPAVYVASSADGNTLVTDIIALKDASLTNVSFSNESGTSVATLRNYYVYADDIDDDGILELPSLITVAAPETADSIDRQYFVRWFSMDIDGNEIDKLYTFHNFAQEWYLTLDSAAVSQLFVEQTENESVFFVWDSDTPKRVFSIAVLSGDSREETAAENAMRVLHRGDGILYAARIEASASELGLTEQSFINAFHLIRRDWKTGET